MRFAQRAIVPAVLIAVLMISIAAYADGGQNSSDSLRCWLSVHANCTGSRVYLDDSLAGRTPIDSLPVAPGGHLLRCMPPDPFEWTTAPVADSIDCPAGGVLLKEIAFPRYVRVSSQPDGATATGDSAIILGQTPLWVPVAEEPGSIRLAKDGYSPVLLRTVRDTVVVLERNGGAMRPDAIVALSTSNGQSDLPMYITSGAAVLTGALAAYFKIKADHLYSDYLNSGDPSTLESIHRYDRASGFALAACEINVAALAFLLFRR